MKKLLLSLLGLLIFFEIVYFNVVYDFILLILLFITSLSFGSFMNIKVFNIDKVLISLATGLSVFGYLLWLSTFYNFNYSSLYLIFSFFVIYLRKDFIVDYTKIFLNFTTQIYKTNYFLLVIVIISLMFYIAAAVSPINGHDALTKHIAIPLRILNYSHYDYNVVQSIVFGDYALFPHMLFTYLLSLFGTKAIVLLVMILSFLTLFMLLRITSFIYNRNIFVNSVALIYLSTPLIFGSSTRLMVDIFPVYFLMASILLLQYKHNLGNNIIYIGILVGVSLFSKQVAAFIIIPIAIIILFYYIKQKKLHSKKNILILAMTVVIAVFMFLPSLMLIWYKTGNPFFPFMNGVFHSPYFTQDSFKDPFHHILRFDFQSLYSIIFHTNKNIEMMDGGIGYYLLLLPFAIITLFVRQNSRIFILLLLGLIGYFLSIQLTYNIRYFLTSIVILIPVSIYFLVILDKKYFLNKNVFTYIGVLILMFFSILVIFNKHNFWGFKKSMLIPDERLLNNPNKSVLKYIPNEKNIKVLSNNDLKRGDFLGQYYTLGWYNKYLIKQFIKSPLTPEHFLDNFDYYLVDNTRPFQLSKQFSPMVLKNKLALIAHSKTHSLYKVIKEKEIILEKHFNTPIVVNVKHAKTFAFDNIYESYYIVIEVDKHQAGKVGRFQINWKDKNGKFLGASISLFKVINGKYIYTSEDISKIPNNAAKGILYLTSANIQNLKIKSFKLLGIRQASFVKKLEKDYGKKFPYIAR